MINKIDHNNIPEALTEIVKTQEAILRLLNEKNLQDTLPKPKYTDASGLIDYLFEKTGKRFARQTLYGWVSNRKIPFIKNTKELRFRLEDIDLWLDCGRDMSIFNDKTL